MGKIVKNIILIFVALLISTFVSSFALGILLTIGGNIQVVGAGLNNLAFDPMITIAYMLLFYFVTLFFQPKAKSQLFLFIFTLFLSFTVTFIQGSVYLLTFYFLLRKANII